MEANSGFDVFGESGTEVAGLILGFADLPAGLGVVDPAAGTAIGIQKGKEDLAQVAIVQRGRTRPCPHASSAGPGAWR